MLKKAFLFSLTIFFVFGCAKANVSNISGQTNKKEYQFATAYCIGDSEESKYLENELNKAFIKEKIKGDDLKILCKIESFDEGNRALRYFIGFGAGSATSNIKIEIKDKHNNHISSFDTEAEMSIGVFGGDAKNTLEASIQKIVSHIKYNYIKTNK